MIAEVFQDGAPQGAARVLVGSSQGVARVLVDYAPLGLGTWGSSQGNALR